VNTLIDLREIAPDVPAGLFSFLILEALEFPDEIESEFHRDPGSEFKRDILVGIGTAIPSGFCLDTTSVCLPDPLSCCEDETVKPGLFSKPVEFDGIKNRVVELLPDAHILKIRSPTELCMSQPGKTVTHDTDKKVIHVFR